MSEQPPRGLTFSYRSARSGALSAAIVAVILIEATAVHFALAARNRGFAWTLTLASLTVVAWLIADYRAMGRGTIDIEDDILQFRIGRRFDVNVPIAAIARAFKPTFRDLPTPGTNQGRDYLNLTKPAAPNVLIVLEHPMRVRLPARLHRTVARFGVKVDDPNALISALTERRATMPAQSM